MSPTLVLLHAFPLDHRLFDGLTLPMPVLTPDQRGFGRRPLADPDGTVPEPSLAVVAADVIALLDAEGLDQVVLGGVSMGGYVALELLSRYPERVAGLVLADTRTGADTDEGRQKRLSMAADADRGVLPPAADRIRPLVSAGTLEAKPEVVAELARISAGQTPEAIAWAQRAMAARVDTAQALATARVPVLGIVGSDDTVTGVDEVRRLVDLAVDGSLVILPGVGHLTPAEDPGAFGAAIGKWWGTAGLAQP